MFKQLIAALATLAIANMASAELRIVTTTTDYADLARQIGGDKVQVHSVMTGPENVHNVMAKPTEMIQLNKADLFVHSGLDAEPWRDNLIRGARNPRILRGRPGWVDMSEGIELKEVPTVKTDRSQGDVHAYGNPHYTMNLKIGQRMVVTLARAMIAADPANGDLYKRNAKALIDDLGALDVELQKKFAPYRGLKVVTYHNAWIYFADPLGIKVVTCIEPKPMISPSPAQLRDVIETMKAQNVKIVIVETYNSFDEAKTVADAAGAQVLVLPDHVNGVPEADTYQDLFRTNVDKLIAAAQAAGIKPAPIAATEDRS
jgi:zinc/manganese transport system substrate-binding protein